MMSDKDLNSTYDAWSRSYDTTPNPLIPIEEQAVYSLLRSINFNTALDAGTGTGRHAIKLAEQGKCVVAVDANRKMLREASKKAQARKLPIKILANDIHLLSFEDESFDLVVCALTLAHIESLEEPYHELIRVLHRNGSLIVSDLHPFVQQEFGPDYETDIVEGKEGLSFPNYHSEVSDYLQAVESSGGEIMKVLDVPLQNKGEVFPGALVVWARKP